MTDMAQRQTSVVRAAAARETTEHDARNLGRDMLALGTLFLVIVTYHLQNTLMLFDVQFGSAFRNATLQPALALMLIVTSLLLVFTTDKAQRGILWRIASAALLIYAAYIALAVLFDFNVFGALLGIDQLVFTERLTDDAPMELLAQHASLTAIPEYIALIAVVILWQPWTRLGVYARELRRNVAPIVVIILALGLWELLINVLGIQEFLLPRPSVIGAAFGETYPRLVSAGWNTFQNALWGFIVGCGFGVISGMLFARFTSFSQALLPLAIGINAVPIVALAPIMNLWFGDLNPASKVAIVAILTYFPAMISTVRGLNSADQTSLELMRSYAASAFEVFTKLRLPSALPFIFSALKVATTVSMIGAIVSEYFGGSTAGLGYRIRDDAGQFRYPEAWAAIFIAALFGIGFYVVVSSVERALLHWHVSFREK
jgi:NitT/TauT family transport system permease protein